MIEGVQTKVEGQEIRPLPSQFTEDFVKRRIRLSEKDVRQTSINRGTGVVSKVARLFERKEPLAGIDDAWLCFDYSEPEDPESGAMPILRFKYVRKIPDTFDARGNQKEESIAEMYFEVVNEKEIILLHRLTNPAYKGLELGSRLLRQAHNWVAQAVAMSEDTQPVRITAYVGQLQVAEWLSKPELGYTIAEGQEELYDEIRKFPERFNVGKEQRDEKDLVFWFLRKVPSGKEKNDKIRLVFSRMVGAS